MLAGNRYLTGVCYCRKGYTLLINTWKRNDLLKKSISHYATCLGLDSIHIVWSEPDPPSKSLIHTLERAVRKNSNNGREIELKFDINKEDSLNNRFKEIKDLKTDVVFSIDDDVIFPCSSVELAFSVWLSAPETMVGFVPRMHWLDHSVCISLSPFPFNLVSPVIFFACNSARRIGLYYLLCVQGLI